MVLSQHDPEQTSCVDRFRRGWRLNNLMSIKQSEQAAGRFGVELIDLSNLTKSIRLPRGVGASLRRWVSKLPLLAIIGTVSSEVLSVCDAYSMVGLNIAWLSSIES